MFRQHAGNVIIHDDDFISMAVPLFRKHAHRCRATSDAHTRLALAVYHRRLARLNDNRLAAIHRHFHGVAVAKIEHCLAGNSAFALRATGQVPHAAQ